MDFFRSGAAPSVAVVDDEPILREELVFQLRYKGFDASAFAGAADFYRSLAVQQKNIVILDIGLEGESGIEICRHLRQHGSQVGVVFLTARSCRDDRLRGLEAGADAYFVKPIDVEELVLVLRQLMVRLGGGGAAEFAHTAARGNWRLDAGASLLQAPDGARLPLTLTEIRLLERLISSSGQTCSHAQLGVAIGLRADEFDKHRIEVIVSRLRSKIQRMTSVSAPLLTDRNQGYRWGAGHPSRSERV